MALIPNADPETESKKAYKWQLPDEVSNYTRLTKLKFYRSSTDTSHLALKKATGDGYIVFPLRMFQMYRGNWRSEAKNSELWLETDTVGGFVKALRLEFQCCNEGQPAGSYKKFESNNTNPIPPRIQQMREVAKSSNSKTINSEKLPQPVAAAATPSSSSGSGEDGDSSAAFPTDDEREGKSRKTLKGKTKAQARKQKAKQTPKGGQGKRQTGKGKMPTAGSSDEDSEPRKSTKPPPRKKHKKTKEESSDSEEDDVSQARLLSLQSLDAEKRKKQAVDAAEDVSKRRSLGLIFGKGGTMSDFHTEKTKAEYLRDRIKSEKEVGIYLSYSSH
jgi:hypothetical protein